MYVGENSRGINPVNAADVVQDGSFFLRVNFPAPVAPHPDYRHPPVFQTIGVAVVIPAATVHRQIVLAKQMVVQLHPGLVILSVRL